MLDLAKIRILDFFLAQNLNLVWSNKEFEIIRDLFIKVHVINKIISVRFFFRA